jgi:RHS repeat-associated protein
MPAHEPGAIRSLRSTSSVASLIAFRRFFGELYALAGNVTKIASTSATLASDTQCFNYDYLQNLTQAWTPADNNCTEAASSSNLGGAAPYWTNYSVDPATGNRLSTIENSTTVGGASTTDTYAYPTVGTANPHAVQTVTHVTSGTTTTSSYGYDAAGDTTTRPGQTLTYDAEGKVTTVTAGTSSQSDVYDASGNLLLEKDSTAGTTLFLGATELHLASGASTASAVRTYTANGIPVAERSTVAGVSGSTLTWLGADAQGTVDLQMNAATGTFGVRLQDPFGNARGASTTTWGDGHGFLNATTDALSGLVQLGARMYDASIGRFLSVDSVLSPFDPQQNNGYSYAHNSPVDLADPSGLTPNSTACSDFGGGCGYANSPSSGGGKSAPKAPPAPGQAQAQSVFEHYFGNTSLQIGVNVGKDGLYRTQALAPQNRAGYGVPADDVFEYFTPADAVRVRYTVGQTKYVFWAWKGEYLGWGDGAEGATYVNPISILGIQWYQRAPQGPNLPTIDVSLAVSGSKLGSFNPKTAQDWTGIYDPAVKDRNLSDIQPTITVNFPNSAAYGAFVNSIDFQKNASLFTPDQGDDRVTLNNFPTQ